MKTNRVSLLSLAVLFLLGLSSCTSGTLLATHALGGLEPAGGSYTLILHGGQNARDLRTVAILDRDGDPYTIVPFGAAFNYRIVKGLSAGEALARGERFINDLAAYRTMERRAIHGADHSVIGYELRPLYMPLTTGMLGDPLQTSYLLQAEGQVTVYVDFKGSLDDWPGGSDHGDQVIP
jgi:hypothetical protein